VAALVRLRIELANAPGSLAGVADVIADNAGNITAIDLQSATAERAVDEVTVEFAETTNLAEVRRQIDRTGLARVLSYQTASRVDLVVRVLQRLTQALGTARGGESESLRRGVAELLATPAVWVLPADAARAYRAGRRALDEPGTAVTVDTDEELPTLGETISGEASLLALANRARSDVLLVARPVAQGFTATETSRVEAFVAFYEAAEAVTRVPADRS
jgi:hypothetical protein